MQRNKGTVFGIKMSKTHYPFFNTKDQWTKRKSFPPSQLPLGGFSHAAERPLHALSISNSGHAMSLRYTLV